MYADPLRRRRLLFIFSVNAYLLRGADIGYLATHVSLTELSSVDVKDIAMDRRRINELLVLSHNIISITLSMLTAHRVMSRHAEIMWLPFDDFCSGCRFAEGEETVIHFLCQCSCLARCKYRIFSSPAFSSGTELSSIKVKSFIKLSDWFSSVKYSCLKFAALVLTNFSLLGLEELDQCRDYLLLWCHNKPLCVLK